MAICISCSRFEFAANMHYWLPTFRQLLINNFGYDIYNYDNYKDQLNSKLLTKMTTFNLLTYSIISRSS